MRGAPFVDANLNPPQPHAIAVPAIPMQPPPPHVLASISSHQAAADNSDAASKRRKTLQVSEACSASVDALAQRLQQQRPPRGPATYSKGSVVELAVQTLGELATVDGIGRADAAVAHECQRQAALLEQQRVQLRAFQESAARQAAELAQERARGAALERSVAQRDAALARADVDARELKGGLREADADAAKAAAATVAAEELARQAANKLAEELARAKGAEQAAAAKIAEVRSQREKHRDDKKAMAKKLPKKLTPLQSAAKSANEPLVKVDAKLNESLLQLLHAENAVEELPEGQEHLKVRARESQRACARAAPPPLTRAPSRGRRSWSTSSSASRTRATTAGGTPRCSRGARTSTCRTPGDFARAPDAAGKAFVMHELVSAAIRAHVAMHGRKSDGDGVRASFLRPEVLGW